MTSRRVFTIAASLGLMTGLGEGVALLSLQQVDLLGWRIARVPIWTEILVISPVADLLLFLALAATVLLITHAAARLGWQWSAEALTLFACSLLLWFDWLTLLGRLRLYAVVPLAIGLASISLRWYRSHPAAACTLARASLPWCIAATVIAGAGTYGREWLTQRIALARLPVAAPNSPNVLIVVLDTVRADHLASYGYQRATTPFIDQLAAEGALFEEAYSTSSWTLPAHASLLTGLLPHDHGATDVRFDGRTPTIGEAMLARGYRTGAFSANLDWFTRSHGFAHGFIAFADFFQSPGDMAGRTIYGRMYDEFISGRLGAPPLMTRVLAEDINRSALDWLDRPSSPAPFFLVLNYFDAHGPYEPPQPYRRKFSTIPNPGGLLRDVMLRQRPRLTQAQVQSEVDAYDGAIAYLDRQMQQLIGELDRRGFTDNILVIVTSDHGESFGEHGLFTHRTALYRELVHVPLILRWPGHVPSHARVSGPVSITDIPATVMDLLKIPHASDGAGQSLALGWAGQAAVGDRRYPVQELARMPFEEFSWVPAYKGAMVSVVTPTWHYIEHETLGREIYDIARDPQEFSNLIATPQGAQAAAQLAEYLHRKP